MSIDLLGPDPIYRQLAAVILKRVNDGTYAPELGPIPSEAALCEEFGVSRNTVRSAVRTLNEEHVLRTVMGRGTYVIPIDRRIAAVIVDRISNGTYRPGHPLPSEAALAKEQDVRRESVRSAIAHLTEEGVLRTVADQGTFIAQRDTAPPNE
ncbi:GntR family transcriptional regulator [Nonomuraea sp. NPDC049400]|uniref:GntR family transcriptional regulator n=1 Tax=Nonomuraea sp. NPDC049400 TaxID=3364352 RepID=UPI0037B8CFB9